MKKRRLRLPALGCKGWALSFWFALLFVVITPMRLPAQERLYLDEHDCEGKVVTLPDNPHLIVRFTADPNVPRSEPPIRQCKFGFEIADQSSKVIGHWGPVILSSPPVREIQEVHGRDIILFGATQFF